MGRTAAQRGHHIVQCGRGQRGDDTDAARKAGQRALALGVEQTFAFEAGLQAHELLHQRALASGAHGLDDHLQLAARLVDRQLAAQLDRLAVARREVEEAGGAPEHRATQASAAVRGAQVEVAVAAGRTGEASQLAPHGDGAEARLQRVADGLHQQGHVPDPGAVRGIHQEFTTSWLIKKQAIQQKHCPDKDLAPPSSASPQRYPQQRGRNWIASPKLPKR